MFHALLFGVSALTSLFGAATAAKGARQTSWMQIAQAQEDARARTSQAEAEARTAANDARTARLKADYEQRYTLLRSGLDRRGSYARADQLERQAGLYEGQARLETETAGYEAARLEDRGKRTAGTQKNEYLSTGLALEGTPAQVIADSARENALDIAAVKYSAAIRSKNMLDQAALLREAAAGTRSSADETFALASGAADEQYRLTFEMADAYERNAGEVAAMKTDFASRQAALSTWSAREAGRINETSAWLGGFNRAATTLSSFRFS